MEKNIKDYLHLEEWKTIPKYPLYEASNFGEVRRIGSEKVLSKYVNQKGYYCIGLTINKKTVVIKNAICVCAAWHPNSENKRTVNHKDTNKLNDYEWNLEWNTHQENIIHAVQNNCRKNWNLSKETIDKIVEKTSKRVTVTDIKTNMSVTVSSINNCALLLQVKQSAISQALKRNSIISKKYKVNYASYE